MITRLRIDPRIRARGADLIDEPRVIRVGKINDAAARYVAAEVSAAQSTGQTVLPVVIDSPGGYVHSLLSIVDTLAASRVPVATFATGRAFSCGAVLLACGKRGMRFAAPNATILVHPVSHVSGGGEARADDLRADAAETERLSAKLVELLERHTGRSQWCEALHRLADQYLTARDARRLGLVDHVRVPTLTTTVSVQSVLR